MLAGGVPVGDRAFEFIIEAPSNDEAERIVRDMPAWGPTRMESNTAAKRRGSRRDGADGRADIEVRAALITTTHGPN